AGAAPTAMQTQMADTTPGMVLGTVGYMSPEQVRGLALDHRTDIFSFGAIFYEMLTGQRAFRGDSHVETMNAILKEDPPEFSAVTANVPGALERVIRRCLEKLPSDRFHSAHDLAISLEAFSGASTSSGVHTGSMAHLQGSAAHQALHVAAGAAQPAGHEAPDVPPRTRDVGPHVERRHHLRVLGGVGGHSAPGLRSTQRHDGIAIAPVSGCRCRVGFSQGRPRHHPEAAQHHRLLTTGDAGTRDDDRRRVAGCP